MFEYSGPQSPLKNMVAPIGVHAKEESLCIVSGTVYVGLTCPFRLSSSMVEFRQGKAQTRTVLGQPLSDEGDNVTGIFELQIPWWPNIDGGWWKQGQERGHSLGRSCGVHWTSTTSDARQVAGFASDNRGENKHGRHTNNRTFFSRRRAITRHQTVKI